MRSVRYDPNHDFGQSLTIHYSVDENEFTVLLDEACKRADDQAEVEARRAARKLGNVNTYQDIVGRVREQLVQHHLQRLIRGSLALRILNDVDKLEIPDIEVRGIERRLGVHRVCEELACRAK
jgi:hypothetical protein